MTDLDPTIQAVLEAVRGAGYIVLIREGSVRAIDQTTGERHVVYGDDMYEMSCELAERVWIELEDR